MVGTTQSQMGNLYYLHVQRFQALATFLLQKDGEMVKYAEPTNNLLVSDLTPFFSAKITEQTSSLYAVHEVTELHSVLSSLCANRLSITRLPS